MLRFCSFLLLFSWAWGQKTLYMLDEAEQKFHTARELFLKEQYAAALPLFKEYSTVQNKKNTYTSDAAYYLAACAIELEHRDGEWLMNEFLSRYPENSLKDQGLFYLIKSAFRKKKYQQIIPLYQQMDITMLQEEEQHEAKFKAAYSYFMLNQDSSAKPLLYEVKNEQKKYSSAATYYYAFLNYQEKKYAAALPDFEKLVNDPVFGKSVPFYITQIYFTQGKYKDVIQNAPLLLENDSVGAIKTQEICRMTGLSYYRLQDYKQAIPWLEKSGISDAMAQENYVLGYCYYHTGAYSKAIPCFEKAIAQEDSLSQSAYYHLAGCHLKLNDKEAARTAFYGAWKCNKVSSIAEDALFQYALLSHELDINPFNESLRAFKTYLKNYPQSPRRNDVIRLMADVYMQTRNYALAIQSIEEIQPMDPVLKVTWQKLVYNYGIELMNNKDYIGAESQFRKSLKILADPKINALSHYRLADLAWYQKSYSSAIEHWKNFQITEGAPLLKEYVLSNYHLGYAYLYRAEKDDYTNAHLSFRKFLMQAPEETEEQRIRKADAYIRAADALFMTRKFELCIEPYSQGIQMNKSDVDYALYQRALCYGLLKKYNEKIADLQQLEKKFPNSPYYLNGLLEMANTLNENKKDPEQALVIYQKILEKEPGTRIRLECYARMGNIYYARKEDDKALVYFDKFLKNDTHSEEAKNIMEQVKAIYKAKGDIAGMEKYFVSLGQPLEENQLEKAAYEDARETYYEKKDFIAALEKWKQYIQRFPNGKNYLEAQYCAGVILYDQKKYEEALPYLQYVTQQARSIYSEDALNKLAFIYYDKKKDYPNALNAYLRLRSIAEQPSVIHTARWGVLRSAYYASSCDTALQISNEILAAEKLTQPDLNAVKYIRLICMYKTGKYDDFIMESKNFPEQVNSVQGAEILFYKATIFKVKKNYTECKSTIKQILRYTYTDEVWKNQTMLLLADMYIETEQFNDAQIALETLLESNPSPEFRQKAEEALKKLQELREQKIKAETRTDNNKMNNILSEDNE